MRTEAARLCTQAEVFEEVSQLVQSALDGYRVAIFAYGATGEILMYMSCSRAATPWCNS